MGCNVDIFLFQNLKNNNSDMWSDWTQLDPPSVLEKFPRPEARQIVSSVLSSVDGGPCCLQEEAEVCWVLEVIKFGARQSPCDVTVTACARLYSSWLSVLVPGQSSAAPRPVRREPDYMGRLMMRQVLGLFTNVNLCRADTDTALETACLTLLEVLETVGSHSALLQPETVTCLLELLLGACDIVLSQPGSSSPRLSSSLFSALCHCWVASSAQSSFPSPSLWSRLVQLARGWRHRPEVVSHWSVLNISLLSQLSPHLQTDTCCSTLSLGMSRERVVQTSFRFLHLLGNIVELTQDQSLSRAPGLVRAARLHPDRLAESLKLLPSIFHQAVRMVSQIVDGYLGISSRPSGQHCLSPRRPRVSTLLHMLGPWLYQASLLDTPFSGLTEQSSSRYSAGRAEALRTLCIIFNSRRFSEEIEEAYLARFYLAIEYGLKADLDEVQFGCLQYFGDLIARNLPGSNILLPQLITSLLKSMRDCDAERGRCLLEILKSVHCFPLMFRDMSPVRFDKTDRTVKLEDFIENIFESLVLYLQREDDLSNCQVILCILSSYMESHKDRWSQWTERLLTLICHRLTSSWSSDYSTCLLALEVIIFVSSSRLELSEEVTTRVLSSVCQFVVLQCYKPPPAHSKDLHSSIILAFQTVTRWLFFSPSLLRRPDCLRNVLEITELAMSGSRSERTDLKENKKPSPVSQRVSRAAEELLSSVMGHVGYFPPTSLSEKASTGLSEETLRTGDPWAPPSDHFKYYFCDKNYILAVSKTSAEEEHSRNTTIAIFRSASGKTVWKFSQSPPHLSADRDRKCHKRFNLNSRFVPRNLNLKNNLPPVDILRPCKVDYTIPGLEELPEEERLAWLVCHQEATETSGGAGPALTIPASEPDKPQPQQSWRMLLSQLGLVDQMLSGDEEDCLPLDSSSPQFWTDLKSLDSLNTRTVQTLCVYYVRRGQSRVSDILANNLSSSLPPDYLRLLSSLGWQVEVDSHAGWDGNVNSTSSHILYWADDLSELAILVPCQPIIETFPDLSTPTSAKRLKYMTDQKVLLVWLESPEDRDKFPHKMLITNTESVSLIIYLSVLECGLVKVEVTTGEDQERTVSPLASGLVTSQSGLAGLVRQTALNVCRRDRLEADTSQQCPALVRRAAILNIRNNYGGNNNYTADNIQSLFI